LVAYFLPFKIPGLGIVITVVLILSVGVLVTNVIGRRLLSLWESLIFRIPLVNTLYRTAKEIVETFSQEKKEVLREVVLVQFPHPGSWAVGFLVGEAGEVIKDAAGRELAKVLVPHVPVPMSGFLLFVPKEDVIFLNIPVEDGLRLIVSTGIIEPDSSRLTFKTEEKMTSREKN
ncbi:MAG: DUF502 domain-containing protein, partial [Firmicutes bacterium]|nr:DUF502 domain-containing protein [Bacillota bacterium]